MAGQGRPPKYDDKALTNAERQNLYRMRHQSFGGDKRVSFMLAEGEAGVLKRLAKLYGTTQRGMLVTLLRHMMYHHNNRWDHALGYIADHIADEDRVARTGRTPRIVNSSGLTRRRPKPPGPLKLRQRKP